MFCWIEKNTVGGRSDWYMERNQTVTMLRTIWKEL
jgi:hypothetical protein